MIKINNEPGVISQAIKKIPDVLFENGAMIVLLALIFELPVRMLFTIFMNSWKNEHIYVAVQSYFVYCGLIIICLFVAKKAFENGISYFNYFFKKNKFMIFITAFLVWGFISSLLADDPYLAFYSNLHRMEGYMTYLYYVIVLLTAALISNCKKKRLILNAFAISSVLICFPSVLKKYEFVAEFLGLNGNFVYSSSEKYSSVFLYFNHYGYFLAIAVLCCAGLVIADTKISSMLFHSLLMLINVWSLIVNDTFGSYIGVAAALTFITFLSVLRMHLRREWQGMKYVLRTILPLIIFLLISIMPINASNPITKQVQQLATDVGSVAENPEEADTAGTGRWRLWKTTAGYIAERPLFGYGSDGIIDKFAKDGFIQDRPANEYLQYAAFFGIPGMIFYVVALLIILGIALRNLRYLTPITLAIGGCVLAYAISACFGNTMYYTTVYFYMFIGLLLRKMKENNND